VKIYDWHIGVNPRRLRIFLAEKGIEVEYVEVGQKDRRLAPWYIEKYPHALVPMLELDDGACIGEVRAIAGYVEELHPEPPLLGRNARERAIVAMWEQRAYEEGLLAAAELFRNAHPAFVDRGLPGSADPIPQIPALCERARGRLGRFLRKFDAQLAENEFVAGPRWTLADATTLCAVDFARRSDTIIPPECRNLARWHEAVSARPSATA